ncbi:hypothetical protein ACFWUP_02640 [Nocardia sp. NPDC058658]|uniref:hypothetical protein n=1 Tax=Nocardia sp. NPDC058658 TaxID=3346580 RepID=UPI0036621923
MWAISATGPSVSRSRRAAALADLVAAHGDSILPQVQAERLKSWADVAERGQGA